MIKIETLTLGALATNCYLVWDQATRQAFVIDPADEADYLVETVRTLELKPKLILATHGHFDHNLATLELVLNLETPFAASPKDQFLLDQLASSAAHWLNLKNEPALKAPPISFPLENNQELHLGQQTVKVLETPGHTPGSLCFFVPSQKLLFSGDTLFAHTVGRTDFKYASKEALKNSLQKIFKLPEETTVYPGHGQSTTLKKEKRAEEAV